MAVIIIAPPGDLHAQTVAWEIGQAGGLPLILSTADFPKGWSISFAADDHTGPRFDLTLADGTRLEDESISGVWWRRTRKFNIPDDVTDKQFRQIVRDDCLALVEGWIHALGDRVVNPLAADLAARRKPLQLARAAGCGLRIPATMISTSPDDVKTFLAANDDEFVYKGLTSPPWASFATLPLNDEAKGNLDLLRLSPCIMQRRIDGGADVRVTVIDQEVFAAEVRARHPEAKLDWRLDPTIDVSPHRLPAEVTRSIMHMQRELGLRYGAYDFRMDADGHYWFFEVNPGGQFLFVEIATGHPISRAIAGALMAPKIPGQDRLRSGAGLSARPDALAT